MNLVVSSERPLTNHLRHEIAVFLSLKNNVKTKMYDIKWNEECQWPYFTELMYYTKKKCKTKLVIYQNKKGTVHFMLSLF